MAFLKYLLLPLTLLNISCQIGYITKNGYYQAKLLWSRQPISEVLNDPTVPEPTKTKLRLIQQAKEFAQQELGLKPTPNYETFVKLDDRYVTYTVTAAPPFELKNYTWKFPIVGEVPYKGFFKKEDALKEELELKNQGYDTYVRGVSAYSSLGWFNDPILSSMIAYDDEDLVNVIIHETVHATLFIKNAVEFNERLATFLGNKGAELFYKKTESASSQTLKKIRAEMHDDLIFSRFISKQIQWLENVYRTEAPMSVEKKEKALAKIQQRFKATILPQLQGKSYLNFPQIQLNNAVLMGLKTYMADLDEFEKGYKKLNSDYKKFLEFCKTLEVEKNPTEKFKLWVATSN